MAVLRLGSCVSWANMAKSAFARARRQIDRSDHTVWARDAFAGDIKGGAVV